MNREEEIKAEIERLQAELDSRTTTLMRVCGKAVKIIRTKFIGRGASKYSHKLGQRLEKQKRIPIIVVKDA